MSERKKNESSFSLPSTGMFALALAVFGLIWSGPSPLIDERPPGHMEADSDSGKIQDVDARMWQDPLGAVQKRMEQTSSWQHGSQLELTSANGLQKLILKENDETQDDHSPGHTIHRIFKDVKSPDSVLMLAVLLPGGPYPEEEEVRRRKRYAVLSALATQGLAPRETEHIGYFEPQSDSGKDSAALPEKVPFEVFDHPSLSQKIIVLWLDDGYFSSPYIEKNIKKIFTQAVPKKWIRESNIRYAVIGPNKSNQLKKLIEWNAEKKRGDKTAIRFYSAGATIDPSRIDGKPDENIVRTIGNDRSISRALVDELKLRQINPEEDHVLLISEWDTLYGRSLPSTFARAYTNNEKALCSPLINKPGANWKSGANIHCVNYMRGVDGILPEISGQAEPAQETPNKLQALQLNTNIDRPSGNNQKDYLRRLVEQIRALDKNIMHDKIACPVRNNGIAAIGILGSDVYDKLMILRALRPFFPGKIFFTTDLDAAYFSPTELPYTHNLIVGSSYGLRLTPELQQAIPPFRDNYQTATFLSTILAVTRKTGKDIQRTIDDWLKKPRIFEIGRKGAIGLNSAYPEANPDSCTTSPLSCSYIHPQPEHWMNKDVSLPKRLLKIASILFGLALIYRLLWQSRWLPQQLQGKRAAHVSNTRKIAIAVMLPLLLIGPLAAAIICWSPSFTADEPFYWANGVSVWPSVLLTYLALLISSGLYLHSQHLLSKSNCELGMEFGLSDEASCLPTAQADDQAPEQPADEHQINVSAIWQKYLHAGTPFARLKRSSITSTFFVLFGLTIIMLSGGLPVPTRGNNVFYLTAALELASAFSVVLLITWLVDTAHTLCKFIKRLSADKESQWPETCIAQWRQTWPEEYVMHWLDVRFVGQYTKTMENFIWYPILPMLLLCAAQSSIFDNWIFSSGLLASITILLLYLFSMAFLMQRTAKDMRAKATRKLGDSLRELKAHENSSEQKIAKLEKMLEEVRENNEGALTPFVRQPMVQALLAFLSGTGGIAVLMERFL